MENKLPEGWEWKRLDQVLLFSRNGISKRQNTDNIGLPVTRIETISNGTVNINKVGYVADLEKKDIEKYKLIEGDILFSHINSLEHIGKTAIYENNSNLLLHGVNLLLLRPNKEIAIPKYLQYFFRNLRNSKFFWSIANKSVNQASINQSRLSKIEIPVPSIETQQKIVSILEKAEETKKLRAQAGDLTQQLLQSVFLEMFGDPVQNPENWSIKQLKECIKIPLNSGWSPKCSDDINGIPVFSLANLQDQGLSNEVTKYYSGNTPKKRVDLEIGDLLISRSNTLELVGRIGRYNGKPEEVIYPDLMIRIRLNENLLNSLFFEKYMQSDSIRKLIQKISHGTSGSMVKISQSSLLKMPVILPPIEVQQKFASIVQKIFQVNEFKKNSSLEINNLFDSLMQKAFTGELVS